MDPEVLPPAAEPAVAASPANPLRSFSTFLANIEHGQLNHDASKVLEEAVAAIQKAYLTAGGKPVATITLKIGLRMDSGHVQVGSVIESKLPKAPRGTSIFYTTPDHTLSLTDPKQQTFPFKTVGGTDAVKSINDAGSGIRSVP